MRDVLGPSPGRPSSWRDFADRLTDTQIDMLAQCERAGDHPVMLFCWAGDLAASNPNGL